MRADGEPGFEPRSVKRWKTDEGARVRSAAGRRLGMAGKGWGLKRGQISEARGGARLLREAAIQERTGESSRLEDRVGDQRRRPGYSQSSIQG